MKTLILLLLMTYVCYAEDYPDKVKYYFNSQIEFDDMQMKNNEKIESDIAESRKREDLLNQEVHLLQYQIDVLTKKDAK